MIYEGQRDFDEAEEWDSMGMFCDESPLRLDDFLLVFYYGQMVQKGNIILQAEIHKSPFF